MIYSDAKPRFSAIAAGTVCLDIFPGLASVKVTDFERDFMPGRVVETDATVFSTGGSVSNTGLALVRLGVKTRLIGKIGRDPFGEIVSDFYRKSGESLTDGLQTDPDLMTSHSFVISPSGEDRRFIHHPGANDAFKAEDIPDKDLSCAGILHFGYPQAMRSMMVDDSRELEKIYRNAKKYDVTTSMDTAMVDRARLSGQIDWRGVFRRTLPSVDLFLPSFEEILFMLDRERFESARFGRDLIESADDGLLDTLSAELLDMGAAIVMIKLGHRGLYLRTASRDRLTRMGRAVPESLDLWENRILKQPAFKVKIAGTTGAGDTCIAGFIAAFLRGLPPEDAAKVASAAAASCCEKPDALSGVQSWDQICERINQGWETL